MIIRPYDNSNQQNSQNSQNSHNLNLKNKKQVNFHPLVQIQEIIPFNRMITLPNMGIQFQIMRSCETASIQLMRLINGNSIHKINWTDFEDYPIKIRCPKTPWYLDTSPMALLTQLQGNNFMLLTFIKEYNYQVQQQLEPRKSGLIHYITNFSDFEIIANAVSRGD